MLRFSEPERCLLQRWTEAQLLEEGMATVRTKYVEIIDEIIERVQKSNKELSCSKVGFPRNGEYGAAGVAKDSWPKNRHSWPSGFYIEDLQLQNLASPAAERPFKSISIYLPDLKELPTSLSDPIMRVLGKEEFGKWQSFSERNWIGLWCYLEPQEELFHLLTEDEGGGFIDCMVIHFEQMVKLTSVLDGFFKSEQRARRG
jgi:hypothetical protein